MTFHSVAAHPNSPLRDGEPPESPARVDGEVVCAEQSDLVLCVSRHEAAVVIGRCGSAAAATIAAGKEPEKVSGLILFGPFLRGASNPIAQLALRLALARPWGPAIWGLHSRRLWPGLGDQASARASRLSSILKRKGHWAAFSKTTRTDHSVVAPWFNRVTAPALVVMGAQDPDWKDPRAEASWAASNFAQGSFVMVEGAGHAPMLESPDAAAREAIAFANRIGFGGTHA